MQHWRHQALDCRGVVQYMLSRQRLPDKACNDTSYVWPTLTASACTAQPLQFNAGVTRPLASRPVLQIRTTGSSGGTFLYSKYSATSCRLCCTCWTFCSPPMTREYMADAKVLHRACTQTPKSNAVALALTSVWLMSAAQKLYTGCC